MDVWSDIDEDEWARSDFTSDIYEISKFTMKCDKLLEAEGTPLQRYRPRYLIVSDFVQQSWCEQQLLYRLSPEAYLMNAPPGEDVTIQESAAAKEVKDKGSNIHLMRELEIQVPVVVPVITREDAWAVKFLNIQAMILAFNSGQCVFREVPVFGLPLGCGLFLYGIIDELQYNPHLHTVEIVELKTRKSSHPPKQSQQDKDKYQVGLYAQIFNELVQGKVTKEMVKKHLGLKLDTPISDGVQKYIHSLHNESKYCAYTLGDILDTVLCQMQTFTCITQATVEYVHQESKTQISSVKVKLDSDKIKLQFARHCEWWQGERGTTGVDIEDCWKCHYCQFVDLCEWRAMKASQLTRKGINT
uniref:Exonuclease V n=1 Tax=Arion vulgaris TaxID=1028688 RepID=A0A0B7BGT0_9EUPU